MPTISSAVLITTLAAVERHWAAAETSLGRAIVLKSGTTKTDLATLRQGFTSLLTTQTTTENERQAAALGRDSTRTTVRNVTSRFASTVRGLLQGTEFAAQLPTLPTTNALPEKQLRAARDIESIWTNINAIETESFPSITLPLTILVKENDATAPVSLPNYRARIATYEAAQDTLRQCDETIATLNIRRNDTVKAAQKILTEYRAAIRALFPEDSEEVLTLPRL